MLGAAMAQAIELVRDLDEMRARGVDCSLGTWRCTDESIPLIQILYPWQRRYVASIVQLWTMNSLRDRKLLPSKHAALSRIQMLKHVCVVKAFWK